MTRYFATFISGCHEIITKRLQQFPNAELSVERVEDGVAVFASSLSTNQLSELRFFNNVYELLSESKEDLRTPAISGTFIIRYRLGAQPQSVPPQIVEHVATATGAQPTAHNPTHEFLLWERTDGTVLWGHMLPRAGFKLRHLEQGELRPELAHIMGLLASLDHKDTVLDPFAGYGAIVRECLQGFHCTEVIAVEYNEHLVPHLKSIPHLIAKHGDAARLPHIDTRSIDRVITDPPWGKFEAHEHLEHLYYEALLQIHRVLRAKGCAVILSGVDFLPKLAAEVGFTIERQYNILVNGQKASLFKLRKE